MPSVATSTRCRRGRLLPFLGPYFGLRLAELGGVLQPRRMTRRHGLAATISFILVLNATIVVIIVATAVVALPAFVLMAILVIVVGVMTSVATATVLLPVFFTIPLTMTSSTSSTTVVIGFIVGRIMSSPSLAFVHAIVVPTPVVAALVARRRVMPSPSPQRRGFLVGGGGIVSPSPPVVVVIVAATTVWLLLGHTGDHDGRLVVVQGSGRIISIVIVIVRWRAHLVEIVKDGLLVSVLTAVSASATSRPATSVLTSIALPTALLVVRMLAPFLLAAAPPPIVVIMRLVIASAASSSTGQSTVSACQVVRHATYYVAAKL
mmetsp:Transcript_14683/g.42261  ORF Transcript_14683/g.42261 Transcript_14683/m.42261 type:complete len:320 (+) Transcript_14683:1272-2231(+)